MSRLTKKDYKEWVYVVGTTINQKASEHLNYINHKLGELEDILEENELDVYILRKIFRALKEDIIIYNNMVCEGISIYCGGRNRLCFALEYCGEKGIRIDEVDVLKEEWRLNE